MPAFMLKLVAAMGVTAFAMQANVAKISAADVSPPLIATTQVSTTWDAGEAQELSLRFSEQAQHLENLAKQIGPRYQKQRNELLKEIEQLQAAARAMLELSVTGGSPAEFNRAIAIANKHVGKAMYLSLDLAKYAEMNEDAPTYYLTRGMRKSIEDSADLLDAFDGMGK